jgi:hypothetical protein
MTKKPTGEVLEALERAKGAYETAAAYVNDLIVGDKRTTAAAIKSVEGSIYRCESDGQRALSRARSLLEPA